MESGKEIVQAIWHDELFHLSNSRVVLSFSSDGCLVGLENRHTGQQYIQQLEGGLRAMPFQLLLFTPDDEEIRAGPEQMRLLDRPSLTEAQGGGICASFSFADVQAETATYDLRLEYTVTVLPNDSETYWEIGLTNADRRVNVESVSFPYVHGVQLSCDGAEETLLFPYYAGIRVPAFLATAARNMTQAPEGAVFRPNRRPADGLVYERFYCGQASMPWLDLHSSTNGLYLASYDPGLLYTSLTAMADPEAECSGLAISKYVGLAASGARWKSGLYGVGLHDGDWHWGADRYRNWAERHMQPPRVPAWFRRRHALMAHYDFKWQDGTICHDFADIPMLYDRATAEGIDHLFLAGWSSGGFDKLYPEFYPDLELGTMLDFARGINYARRAGGFVTLYINTALFGQSSQYADRLGRRWAVRNRDGSLLQRHFFDEDFYVHCRGVPAYQRLMRDTVSWLATCFGVSGVYLDCFAAISPHLCFDTSHGHPHAGSWNQDAVRTLMGIEESLRGNTPDVFTMIEGCGDAFAQYVSAQLIHAWIVPESLPEMYRYVYPEHCLVDMVYPSKGQKFRAPRISSQAYEQLYRSLVVGVFLWFYDQEDARYCNFRTDPQMWEEIKRCLALRESAWPFFAYGRFMDDVGVNVTPGLVAKLYTMDARRGRQVPDAETAPHDAALVAVWNKTGQTQKITVDPEHLPGRDGATDCWRVSVRGLHETTYTSMGCLPELGTDCPKLLRIPVSEAKITFVLLERAENEGDT
jgi:hypothetical protein